MLKDSTASEEQIALLCRNISRPGLLDLRSAQLSIVLQDLLRHLDGEARDVDTFSDLNARADIFDAAALHISAWVRRPFRIAIRFLCWLRICGN